MPTEDSTDVSNFFKKDSLKIQVPQLFPLVHFSKPNKQA